MEAEVINAEMKHQEPAPPPPPSYFETVLSAPPAYGTTQFQESTSIPTQPTFTYIDFMPDGFNSKYPELVEKANNWLSSNRGFLLKSCESVTVPVKKGVICVDDSVSRVALHNGRDWATILRCWITKTDDVKRERPQVIRTLARMPQETKKLSVFLNNSFHITYNCGTPFESESKCLENLNNYLKDNPLPGKILRVETIKKKVTETMSMIINLDPDVLHWSESSFLTHFAYYTRVFYLEGEPANEQIGWKDIVPAMTLNPANQRKPKFASFTETFHKVGQWANTLQDKRITNLQTLTTPVLMDPPLLLGNSRPVLYTNTNYMVSRGMGTQLHSGTTVNFLRAYYVTSPSEQVEKPYCLTQRPFLPYRLTPRTYEAPVDNIRRLGIWLDYNKFTSQLTEKDILCMESVNIPTSLLSERPINEGSMSYHDTTNQFVSAIRLYLNGVYQEPPLHVIGYPPPVTFTSTPSGCCTIL